MAGDLINLNRVRKARAKSDAKALAAKNRVSHGLTGGQRGAARNERERAERAIDAHKREE